MPFVSCCKDHGPLKEIAPESDLGAPGAGTEVQRAAMRLARPSRTALPEDDTETLTEPDALIDA